MVGKKWVGEICRGYGKEMLNRHAITIEQFKTSAMGGTVADENIDMRKMTQFNRIWPDFIGIIDQADQHKHAYAWYTMSMSAPVSGGIGCFIGAAANPVYVKYMSNWDYSVKAVKSSQYRWSTNAGKNTATAADDVLTRKNGVSTW